MTSSMKIWMGIGAFTAVAAGGGVSLDENGSLSFVSAAFAAQDGEAGEAGAGNQTTAGGEAGEAGEGGATESSGTFEGDLDQTITYILTGTGNEGGAGLSPMWPRVSAPALTGPEIRKVVAGNTLQTIENRGYYFAPDGRLEGWTAEWNQIDNFSACPKPEVAGDPYYLAPKSNTCWTKTATPLAARWKIEDHQLCIVGNVPDVGNNPCSYVTILLDAVALFDQNGKVIGEGMKLTAGRTLAH